MSIGRCRCRCRTLILTQPLHALNQKVEHILRLRRVTLRIQRIGHRLLVVHQSAAAVEEALTVGGWVSGRDFFDSTADRANVGGDGDDAEIEGVRAAFEVARRDLDAEGDVGGGSGGRHGVGDVSSTSGY